MSRRPSVLSFSERSSISNARLSIREFPGDSCLKTEEVEAECKKSSLIKSMKRGSSKVHLKGHPRHKSLVQIVQTRKNNKGNDREETGGDLPIKDDPEVNKRASQFSFRMPT